MDIIGAAIFIGVFSFSMCVILRVLEDIVKEDDKMEVKNYEDN